MDGKYEMLEDVVTGKMVFIDYKNGIFPQMEVKYIRGGKDMIRIASAR